MDFQFVLPCLNSDLLHSVGDNYYVKNVYTPAELPEKLRICKQLLYHGDPFYIFDHFDTYFAVIENPNTDSTAVTQLMRTFDLLYMTVDKLGERLAPVLSSHDAQRGKERSSYLNLVKMAMFLFVNTVKRIDNVVHRTQQQSQQNQQKKRGNKNDAIDLFPDWDTKRGRFLVQLFNVMQFPLEQLWNPPLPEENFVNLLCDICYRTLEIHHYRSENRHIGDTVFQIFGTAIKRYNHAITFPVRILQILRTSEHSAVTIANGIHLLHEEYGISSIFSVLIKDIVETLSLDSADSVISRNFSNFLMELAGIDPKLMIPHLSTLCDELLNCESHVLRNCILQIMGDAIVGELTSEELSDDLKDARNEFLENLLAHINDVSAHVRAKVLQIWNHMKEDNAVPLSFQLKVLCEAVDRLEDKTSSVRKHAVLLIKSFLERNPFAAKLTLLELVKKHEEECQKMEKLSELLAEERKKAEELDEQWNVVIPHILPFVEESLTQATQVEHETQENYEDLVQRISGLLLEKKYREAVVLVRKADFIAGNSELRHTLRLEEQCAYYMALLKSYMFLANGCKDSNEELGTQIKTVQFLQDSIEFSKVITKAVPKIQELLLSKTNSDVFEAVDLFTTGYLFGIKGTECGMRQMLYLVWSSDKEKRDAVSNAYKKVLFTTDQTGRAHAVKVVQNLLRFLTELEYGHYTAMECLVTEWVATDDFDALIIQVLFELFTLKLEGTSNNDSRLALQLLIMSSNAKAAIASANINVIETIGLGERAKADPRIFTSCLEFLLNSIDASMSTKFYKRYESNSPMVQKVTTYFQSFFFHPRIPDFDKLAMKTLEFFYKMCQTPDVICQNIVVELMKKFRGFSVKICEISASQQVQSHETPFSQQIPGTQATQQAESTAQLRMPVFLLTRFIFIVGYMTLKEMIFLDIDVYNNMKYRQELTDCEQKKKKNTFNQMRRKTASLMNMSATESLKRLSGTAAEPQQEPDEDLVGATAEDNIAELINHICEDVLLYADKALLAKIFPYVMEICKYPVKYKDQQLQQAATLTLIRFMSVSSIFCEAHMPFLMNILNYTKNIKIKCNIVIGLSDLTFRFPNIIEPWTGHFYSTLHEENTELRLTAVKMLSHLILHEMIRVKGQIADLAMCIVDPDDGIKNITQQFFKEIGSKSNILYNVLPDIISKLSDTNLNLEEERYRIIMRYILGLIQKDRQVETLVEKLCLRFPVTREERQWRDIAYCLSLLTYNERAIKKLVDNMQHYKDKVQIDEVYQSFKLIISTNSKMAKPEVKAAILEFETRLNECLEIHDPNVNSEAAGDSSNNYTPANRDKRTKLRTGRRAQRGRGGGGGGGRKNGGRRASRSSKDSTDESSGEQKKKARQRSSKTQQKQKPQAISSETSSEDERPTRTKQKEQRSAGNITHTRGCPPTARSKQSILNKQNNQRKKVIQESASSDDSEDIPLRKRGRGNRK